MATDGLQTFIDDVDTVVRSRDDEHEITTRVAKRLSDLLAGGYRLAPELTRPSPERHVTYPLYLAPDNSWSMASVVWTVGQRTPVHSHETWAVGDEPTVGIHVYGGNIGTIRRRSYDPATGEARWFVSGWDSPEG